MDERATRLAELVARSRLVRLDGEDRTRHSCSARVHSYAGDGSLVCWAGDGMPRTPALAVDVERARQPVPPVLARRWGDDDPATFWPRWCAAEVVAKLTGVPMVRLAQHGPPWPTSARQAVSGDGRTVVHWVTGRLGDLVV
ncbi:MAG: hypothetical protein ABIS35_06570, partial [Terracoccus sp.]